MDELSTINEEPSKISEKSKGLRAIMIVAGILLLLFSIIGFVGVSEFESLLGVSFVITILIVLPIMTGLLLIDIGLQRSTFAKLPSFKLTLYLLTGCAWIASSLFTIVLSTRNIIQGRSTILSIIYILLSIGVVVSSAYFLRKKWESIYRTG